MEGIEEKHHCLRQLSQGGTFLFFPRLQQELYDLEGEYQHWSLGPEKDYITRHLPRDSVPSHSTACASHFPPTGIHIHVKTPQDQILNTGIK